MSDNISKNNFNTQIILNAGPLRDDVHQIFHQTEILEREREEERTKEREIKREIKERKKNKERERVRKRKRKRKSSAN